ncbi:MAG: 4Fe-4S dicluster domain-containing protein [Humidesulfovibrio sp.]|nr:4Fe-4S dicluster domain-containing protein [Humidesulfovibrio sp.]MDQ7836011.1 4Fe-4S dicluster domain-containing protein [Humidesulfovibrio sp.]
MDLGILKQALAGKSGARLKLWMEICARCGLCAQGCHFFQSDPRPEHVPAYRLKPLAELIRKKGDVDEAFMQWLVDTAYGTCTMCQRCTMFCPHGISIAFLVRATRALAVSQGMTPQGLASGLANALEFGNNLGITEEEYIETVEWQLEELQAEMPDAVAPIDKKGAEVLVTFHPRDIKFYPQNLYCYLKLYNAAGLDFTLTSAKGWDSTNIGLFAGDDPAAAELAGRVVAAGENLGVRTILTAE